MNHLIPANAPPWFYVLLTACFLGMVATLVMAGVLEYRKRKSLAK